jgi:ATP-dependent RNA helicase MRH4, mitochondrial
MLEIEDASRVYCGSDLKVGQMRDEQVKGQGSTVLKIAPALLFLWWTRVEKVPLPWATLAPSSVELFKDVFKVSAPAGRRIRQARVRRSEFLKGSCHSESTCRHLLKKYWKDFGISMMPSRSSSCIRCEFRAFLSSYLPPTHQWQSRRSLAMAMRQRKKPSRMVLSSDVGLSSDEIRERKRRAAPSPFGGMNQTEARIPVRREPPRVTRARAAPQRTASQTRTSPEGTEVIRTREKSSSPKIDKPLYHALKMQQTLTPVSYYQRTAIKEKLDSIQSFEHFNLLPDVNSAIYSQALAGMTELVPTPVQKLAIPALLSKKEGFQKSKREGRDGAPQFDQFLLAAETGSGKTLAYLLPVIDALKRQEELDTIAEAEQKEEDLKRKAEKKDALAMFDLEPPDLALPHTNMGRPRALILLPSSELVAQVGKVVKLMGHTIKYKSASISSNLTPTVIRSRLFNPNGIDIVISTPHLISSIAEKDPNILSRVTHIVVDEADSLLDRSFSNTTTSLIDRAAPTMKQLILCSATIPRSLDNFLNKRFPTIKRLVTPKLHSIPRRVQLGVVDIEKAPYSGQRQLACADVIWQIGKSVHEDTSSHHTVKCMLVFVNEREQAEELAAYLASKGIEAVPLTRDTPEARQSAILSAFTERNAIEGDEKPSLSAEDKGRSFRDFVPFDSTSSSPTASSRPSSKRLPNTKVLVTTDLGSRGIDTLAVRHVILYDVPHTTIDFVHRLGRTGRMGRRGRGIVLVGKHDRKDVVREVKEAMFKGQALI